MNTHTLRVSMRHAKRVLIRVPNWIGDAVMSEPALAAVRDLFPAATITALGNPTIAELLKGHPALDDVMIYESTGRHAGLAGRWALAREVRRRRFTLAILFQNAFEAALLSRVAGIPSRYGYATDGRGWLLTDAVAVPARTDTEHQVHYYVNLLRPLGWKGTARAPRLFLSDVEIQDTNRRLVEAGLSPAEELIGMNPGSMYGGAKRWLPERFAETANRLQRTHGGRVAIVGAKGEEALARAIAEAMPIKPILLSGRTSVRDLMAVIRRCRLLLTNDTGPMHIASAFGVPVVAVFGPTDSRTTAPFDGEGVVRQPVQCAPCLLRECPIDHRCMTRVSVEQVYNAAVRRLKVQDPAPLLQPSARSPQPSSLKGVTVFLDRDGTINRDTGYVRTPDELELFPGAVESLARLNQAGARLVLITNQSGIARRLFTHEALKAIHARLRALFHSGGASIDSIYFCPHHPDDECVCRKPLPGMVTRAVADLGIDLSRSYLIGDQKCDMELAGKIGARSVLVTTGPTSAQTLALMKTEGTSADHVAIGLSDAVEWIFHDVERYQAVSSALASRAQRNVHEIR